MPRLSEFQRIEKLFAPLAAKALGALGLSDDAALLEPAEGQELVITVDTVVGGVHFFDTDPPELIAKKALRVNLSDLAAKGAAPLGYFLALSLPSSLDDDWLARFASGLNEDQDRFGLSLLGGDTTATPGPLTISITALGTVAKGMMLRRSGARAGDVVFVSGTVGDAAAGLHVLKGEGAALPAPAREHLIERYRLPEPRLALGRKLLGLAFAALDVSDGLIADLGHMAKASKVRIAVDASRIPLSPECLQLWGRDSAAIVQAATQGDDYELAFAAPGSSRVAVAAAASMAQVSVREIGRVEAGEGVVLLDDAGIEIAVGDGGYRHF